MEQGLENLGLFSLSAKNTENDKEQSEEEEEVAAGERVAGPDLDKFMPGFSERYHKNTGCKSKKVKKFNYGDFVAAKVRDVKLKRGKKFTDKDFARISRLVNEAVVKHQKLFEEHLKKQKTQKHKHKVTYKPKMRKQG